MIRQPPTRPLAAPKVCEQHGQKLRRMPPEEGADRYKCYCAHCGRFYGYALLKDSEQAELTGSRSGRSER
jgi:hypothetical protein